MRNVSMLPVILTPRSAGAAPLQRIRNPLLAEQSKRAATRREALRGASDDITMADVRAATLTLADARIVVAHDHAFETWTDLEAFADAITGDGPVARFESAVEAVISGDVGTLRPMFHDHPDLVRARSTRRHHATLLHYVRREATGGAWCAHGLARHGVPGTPLGWTMYGERPTVAAYLRARGAPE